MGLDCLPERRDRRLCTPPVSDFGFRVAKIFKIKSKGRLEAIVISHPHYYTTYAEWAKAFDCPIIISKEDEQWLCRKPPTLNTIEFLEGPCGTTRQVVPGVTAIKAGGHFPGSLVLHWGNKLFIADTIVTVPVGL